MRIFNEVAFTGRSGERSQSGLVRERYPKFTEANVQR